jgi:hypothetical protein
LGDENLLKEKNSYKSILLLDVHSKQNLTVKIVETTINKFSNRTFIKLKKKI